MCNLIINRMVPTFKKKIEKKGDCGLWIVNVIYNGSNFNKSGGVFLIKRTPEKFVLDFMDSYEHNSSLNILNIVYRFVNL